MPSWEGHRPATSAVLIDLITTAHSGRVRFSRSERVLFTACEFWAAARNRSLLGLLSEDAESQLRAAEGSFTAMGLAKSALVLRRGREKLMENDPPVTLRRLAGNIETALADIDEPVDEVIAGFASGQAWDRLSKP
ncbi:MAG: hypothetical protein QOG17_3289 [Gammaproteobacteria bacterium]|jgi:hypothetical protein|nr:hypothetical protein [Gammaproteobacteria bacterium]